MSDLSKGSPGGLSKDWDVGFLFGLDDGGISIGYCSMKYVPFS